MMFRSALSVMLDIDYRATWSIGKGEFAGWFVPAGLLTNFLYARRTLGLSWRKSASANVVMTAAAWAVTVALPIWLVLWAGMGAALDERLGNVNLTSWSWCFVLPLAGVILTGAQIFLLRCFGCTASKARIAMLIGFNVLCIVLASYRTWTYVISHPPLA